MRGLRRLWRRISLVRPRRETGAVAVEMALITSLVLAPLLLGTITTGYSFSHAMSITSAVREGARFGATADASSASWASDVLGRVRTTQFDPSGGDTSICVQLWKVGAASPSVKSSCDLASGPALAAPTTATANPAVPTGASSGQCVVRVIAARQFTINWVVGSMTRTMTRSAVARYEGQTCG